MIYSIVRAFIIGFLFCFVNGGRVMFMVADKPLYVALFSWGITITWVLSAQVAVESPWYIIAVLGFGCMFGNLAAMRYARRGIK